VNKFCGVLICLLAGFGVYWLIRFIGWFDSLTTMRTAFYWQFNHFAAWAMGCIVCIGAFLVGVKNETV
jgi:hypothetical protein